MRYLWLGRPDEKRRKHFLLDNLEPPEERGDATERYLTGKEPPLKGKGKKGGLKREKIIIGTEKTL